MEESAIITTVLIVLAVLITLLIFLLVNRSSGSFRGGSRNPGKAIQDEKAQQNPCPLCGTLLDRNERIKSVVYPGEPDKLMHIFGCPRCYPEGEKRRCPACRKELPAEGYVIARVFEKPGKTHVHVLGCTLCRMG